MLSFNPQNGFSYLYKNALDLTFLLSIEPDHRYRFLSANKSFFDVTAMKESEVIGKCSDEVLKKKDIALVHRKYKEVIELKETMRYEEGIYLFTKLFTFETTLTPILDESGNCIQIYGVVKDITEKKSLETQLRNANENFTALVENIKACVWSVDKNLVVNTLNSRFKDDFRLLFGQEIEVGEKLLAKVSPELKTTWTNLYKKAFTGEHFTVEQCYPIDGQDAHVEISFHSIPSEDNAVTKVFAFSREITKRKLADKKLNELMLSTHELNQDLLARESELNEALQNLAISNHKLTVSEEYFRALIKHSSDLISIIEKDGTIRYESPSFYRVMGNTEREVLGKKLFDFVHPDDLEKVKNTFKECLQSDGIIAPVEFKVKKKNDVYITIEAIWNNCLNDKNISGIIINSRDITVRKGLEDALQKSTKAALDMLESAPFPIVLSTLQGKILYHNDRAVELFKTSIDKNPNLVSHDFFVNVTDRERLISIIKEQGYVNDFEMKMKDAEGNTFYALDSIKTIYYEDKMCLISFINNINERKIAEEKIIEKNIELEKTNKELDRFVYSASHDLRSPITSVLGLINIAKSETNDTEQHKYFDLMDKSLLKLDQFIKEIIQYSKNSRLDVKKEDIDMNKLVAESIESLHFMEGANKIDYITEIKQPFSFFSDASRITVLLNNLISNAIKYHNYKQEQPYIKISILTLYDHAIISIKDNGKGLKEEHIRKIFNMFYVVAENNAGTGIGLYIVKETIEKLGGKIKVESEYGKGSNFIIEIPNQQLTINENKEIQNSAAY